METVFQLLGVSPSASPEVMANHVMSLKTQYAAMLAQVESLKQELEKVRKEKDLYYAEGCNLDKQFQEFKKLHERTPQIGFTKESLQTALIGDQTEYQQSVESNISTILGKPTSSAKYIAERIPTATSNVDKAWRTVIGAIEHWKEVVIHLGALTESFNRRNDIDRKLEQEALQKKQAQRELLMQRACNNTHPLLGSSVTKQISYFDSLGNS